MKELLNLGKLYPSDFIPEGLDSSSQPIEMKLIKEKGSGLVRLERSAEPESMYGKYWYRSGTNSTMKLALKDVVDSIMKRQPFEMGDIWLDIASNDGTLLSYVPMSYFRMGIDPADNTYRQQALRSADEVIRAFFSADEFKKARPGKKAKVITSIAMFYDVPNPEKFIQDVRDIMEDDGIWVMQLSYTPLMILQTAFDNICHEHLFYYSLFDLKKLLEDNGLAVVDCELNDVNGGSMRVYIRKPQYAPKTSDVSYYRIQSLIAMEMGLEMDGEEVWRALGEKIAKLKTDVVSFIKTVRGQGSSVWAYGASTKGNTLLQYFGLDHTMIDGIAERNPVKYNHRTLGTNIPIYSEAKMREVQPDYLLILPWHFISEFTMREANYLKAGGKFIVPCPEFKIISK